MTAGLLESELFGHERGAFTGAVTRTEGRFQRAHTGTLLLDEIGDLPLELHLKLLRILQEQELERPGSSRTIPPLLLPRLEERETSPGPAGPLAISSGPKFESQRVGKNGEIGEIGEIASIRS